MKIRREMRKGNGNISVEQGKRRFCHFQEGFIASERLLQKKANLGP